MIQLCPVCGAKQNVNGDYVEVKVAVSRYRDGGMLSGTTTNGYKFCEKCWDVAWRRWNQVIHGRSEAEKDGKMKQFGFIVLHGVIKDVGGDHRGDLRIRAETIKEYGDHYFVTRVSAEGYSWKRGCVEMAAEIDALIAEQPQELKEESTLKRERRPG